MSFLSEARQVLRAKFISGLLVVVPLILTFVLLRALVLSIDSLLRPVVIRALGPIYFPLAGLLITFILIMFAGFLTANVIGNQVVKTLESLILRIPLVRFLYGSAKQLVQAISVPDTKAFKSVVMVEYPRQGIHALGFLVNYVTVAASGSERKMLTIFIPSTPTPITGNVILLPEEEVRYLTMTIEEGIKFLVSGGILSPAQIYSRSELESK